MPKKPLLDDEVVRRWLEGDYTWGQQVVRRARAVLYKLPQFLQPLRILHWVGKLVLAIAFPVVALTTGMWIWQYAVPLIVVIVGFTIVTDILALLKGDRRSAPERASVWLRVANLLNCMTNSGEAVGAVDYENALSACLALVHNNAQIITQVEDSELRCTLMIYTGAKPPMLKIHKRDPGNQRPCPRTVPAAQLLGHRACQQSGEPIAVQDLREFGPAAMQSPTNQTVDQRSILFMPLKNPAEQDGPPMGFVSIDCKRPFAFYGARARDIASDCQALVDQIAAIVAVQPNTAKPKTRNA